MNVKEKLLHNEIQSLGQMIQIVSYELTLLSDFMKEKFGSSYESFRENHSQQANIPQPSLFAGAEVVSAKKISATARKSTSPLEGKRKLGKSLDSSFPEPRKQKKIEEIDSDDDNDDDDSNVNDSTPDHCENPVNDSAMDDCSVMACGDEDDHNDNISILSVVGATDIPQGAELLDFSKPKDPNEKMIGRVRSTIWNKYIVSKLPNGKLHAQCPRCKHPVSCKVERLTGHYRKCVLEQGRSAYSSASSIFSAASLEVEDDKRKVTEYIKALKKNHGTVDGGGDDNSMSETGTTISTSNLKEEGNEIVFDSKATGGRKADPVWEYFRVLEDPETKRRTVKCKRCDVSVSSKVERVRRHFVICQELDKEGDVQSGS